MKKVMVGLVVLLSVTAFVNAAEEETALPQDLEVTLDLSYTSKYIWRGFDVLGDQGAWQPSINVDLSNGFTANIWASYSDSSGTNDAGDSRVNATEYNYTLAYNGSAWGDSAWKTDYQVGWRYYDFIDSATRDADVQELFLTGSMPALTGVGVVPRFGVFQMWEAWSGGATRDYSGTIYQVGFGYDFNTSQVTGSTDNNVPLTFSWDIVYNDGTGGQSVEHDLSHMVWGLGTSLTCPVTGATITPTLYFQNSFEDSVNSEDELWLNLSFAFKF
ncbi:MAG: hypothetical protein ABFR90_01555 [Planctomycetota bacterium]